jgi:hypothetical protein
MSRVFLPRGHSPQRPHWLAGVGELELRNVVANYPFETLCRFAAKQPNSGHGDHSRLSCSAGDTQLGTELCRDLQEAFCTGVGRVAEKARIGRDLFRSEDHRPAAKPATPLLSLRWTSRARRACVVRTHAEPARLAPLTPPAPMGLRSRHQIEEAVARREAGETLTDIGRSYGVSHSTISRL